MAGPLLLPSPNHDARPAGVRPRLIIVHYTGMPSASAAIARLLDPAARVSAHYLVDEDGTVVSLVPEERRAWHAGVGGWGGIDDVNAWSIGIELVNPGHEWGYRPFPPAQITRLIALASAIQQRHRLPATAVIGHSDTAPARKTDPGELFPWGDLARHGLGVWPITPALPATASWDQVERHLTTIGYRFDLPDTQPCQVIAAFQRHWRQRRVDGRPDPETVALIGAVAGLYQVGATAT